MLSPNNVFGTQISLFRLPEVECTLETVDRILVTISLTVVLPLLPVIAIKGIVIFSRQDFANNPIALRVFFTLTKGLVLGVPRSTINEDAPFFSATEMY